MDLGDYIVFLVCTIGLGTQIFAEFKINSYLRKNSLDYSFPKRVMKLMRTESSQDSMVGRLYLIRFYSGLALVILGFIITFFK